MPVREGLTFTNAHKKGLFVLSIVILVLTAGTVSIRQLSKEENLSLEFAEPFFTSPVYTRDSASRLDINLADSAQWVSLKGIGPILAKRILNYRRSLGGFSSIEQVAQVYGLSQETFETIAPYLFVNEITAPAKPVYTHAGNSRSAEEYPLLDINLASAEELKKLPGIGDVLSERIVRYRSSLKGFESVEDLGAVYGLKPETLSDIRDYLYVNTMTLSEIRKNSPEIHDLLADNSAKQEEPDPGIRSLNDLPFEELTGNGYSRGNDAASGSAKIRALDLNTADSAELITLPGIGAVLSGKIIRYRNKVGYFFDVSQLRDIYGLSEENYQRMSPYLYIGSIENYPKQDLNTVYFRVLAAYPAIDLSLAETITQHRKKTGRFDSWDEVARVKNMTPEALEVLKAYFKI
ncbi:MAG: helix-hairpin-helix domain-containing protein [Bacteroidia bacterium]